MVIHQLDGSRSQVIVLNAGANALWEYSFQEIIAST